MERVTSSVVSKSLTARHERLVSESWTLSIHFVRIRESIVVALRRSTPFQQGQHYSPAYRPSSPTYTPGVSNTLGVQM